MLVILNQGESVTIKIIEVLYQLYDLSEMLGTYRVQDQIIKDEVETILSSRLTERACGIYLKLIKYCFVALEQICTSQEPDFLDSFPGFSWVATCEDP